MRRPAATLMEECGDDAHEEAALAAYEALKAAGRAVEALAGKGRLTADALMRLTEATAAAERLTECRAAVSLAGDRRFAEGYAVGLAASPAARGLHVVR